MAKMKAKKRNDLPDEMFGLPDQRKYPLNDEAHVKAAVRLFGKCPDEDKPRLARNILRRAKELNMDSSGWKVVHAWANKSNDKGDDKKKSSEETTTKQESYIPLSEFDHYFKEGFLFGTNKFKHSGMNLIAMINDAVNKAKEIKDKIHNGEWGKIEITDYWKHSRVKDENGKMKKVDSLADELSEIKSRVQKLKTEYKMKDDNKCNRCSAYKDTILTFKMIFNSVTGVGSVLGRMVDKNYEDYAMHDICEIIDKFKKDSKEFIKVISAS